MNYSKEGLINELDFKAVRSSGSGGQHVNKVSSKVELHFNLMASEALDEGIKARLEQKWQNRLTKEGELILQCDDTRSQHKNKERVIKRFFKLLDEALVRPKKRKPTKPSKAAIKKRLKSKKIRSEKKASRQKPDIS
ncbi:alternative ribosome rescue aminoacyl-tRNA hydrolase ArfB [Gaetbulibacter aestuarii]|uniref:Alternative ribosome rescue aminoacyl-tRNA hydrolase ArfB n=1 Tax=Gaetbulibacter aestuarii TaxID=1502358 RepID=A0ABW7MW95_9FLAO